MNLYYHGESDSLFASEPGDWQQTADGALSDDVTDEIWALERAFDEQIEGLPAAWLQASIARLVIERENEWFGEGLPPEDHPYWSGL